MEPAGQIRISVRELVEFLLRGGDIDRRRTASAERDAMLAGGRLHRKIQRQMGAGYKAEVALKHTVDLGEFTLVVEGRADGVLTQDGTTVIDEIKGVARDLDLLTEPVGVHRAQAMCYAYFIGCDRELTHVGVQITYCNLETEEIRRFREDYTFEELRDWFSGLIRAYKKWALFLREHRRMRDVSLRRLSFPYPYREGQRELAEQVYRAILLGENLFIQAPTGVGKTLSVVYPALKAVGGGAAERLFYLTAKTTTQGVAEECFDILRGQGLCYLTVTVTAREKACPLEKPDCNPDACERAKGHYDRVNDALYALITEEEKITREKILRFAEEYRVCPYELCLDVCDFADGIICDYNYVFDPNVRLRRFLSQGEGGGSLFLVDEAHNLVGRAREMFSATLLKEEVLATKRILKDKSARVVRCLDAVNKSLLALKKTCDSYRLLGDDDLPMAQLISLFAALDTLLDKEREFEGRDAVLNFYFTLRHFIAMSEDREDCYRIYCEKGEDSFALRLFAIDPSKRLAECLEEGRCAIFFSATLLPIRYYKELLSGNTDDYAVYAKSPFDPANRLLLIGQDVSSRYTRRNEAEYRKVVDYILALSQSHKGNYMVFFPSYSYMEAVERLLAQADTGALMWKKQRSRMTEAEKEEFLAEFEKEREVSFLGLCVLGGVFSEGIDLKEERLLGAVIVGTGVPQVCPEQEILMDYFAERGEDGYDYAYRIPGMNKVMQAAGRVIRTATDRGVILLLDDRFLKGKEQSLFPREWEDLKTVTRNSAGALMRQFWEKA